MFLQGVIYLTDQAQLLPGTLDLLILRAVSLGPLHGYGILLRIGQISGEALLIEQGALYPGLFRLVRQGAADAAGGAAGGGADSERLIAKGWSLVPRGNQGFWAGILDGGNMGFVEWIRSVSDNLQRRDAVANGIGEELRVHILHRAADLGGGGLARRRGG